VPGLAARVSRIFSTGDAAMPHASFLVQRNDLRKTLIADDAAADAPLADGQARLRIDLFALTANNVTYGAFGETIRGRPGSPSQAAGGRATWSRSTGP
jgi:hypothetical protein